MEREGLLRLSTKNGVTKGKAKDNPETFLSFGMVIPNAGAVKVKGVEEIYDLTLIEKTQIKNKKYLM